MISSELLALARLLAGEFDNREQAIDAPAWFVHLRLWQRPVPLFLEDSLTLFAEQANVLYPDRPYRQRILRLQQTETSTEPALQVQYYALKAPELLQGAGCQPTRLKTLSIEQVELLPGCLLTVSQPNPAAFVATPPANTRCYFTYQGEIRQVVLGFEANPQEFLSYDRGVDSQTGQALWGAIAGPYRFIKRKDFSEEFSLGANPN